MRLRPERYANCEYSMLIMHCSECMKRISMLLLILINAHLQKDKMPKLREVVPKFGLLYSEHKPQLVGGCR